MMPQEPPDEALDAIHRGSEPLYGRDRTVSPLRAFLPVAATIRSRHNGTMPLPAQWNARTPVSSCVPSEESACFVKRSSGTKMISGRTYLPRQIAESGLFADQLDAQQHAKQPDCGYRKAGPKIKSYQYRKDAAR
jgi:hypothetical protein